MDFMDISALGEIAAEAVIKLDRRQKDEAITYAQTLILLSIAQSLAKLASAVDDDPDRNHTALNLTGLAYTPGGY